MWRNLSDDPEDINFVHNCFIDHKGQRLICLKKMLMASEIQLGSGSLSVISFLFNSQMLKGNQRQSVYTIAMRPKIKINASFSVFWGQSYN